MASPLFVLGAALLLSLLNGTTAAQGTHAEDCQPDESGLLQVQSRRMDAPVDCFKAAVLHFVDNPFDAKYADMSRAHTSSSPTACSSLPLGT